MTPDEIARHPPPGGGQGEQVAYSIIAACVWLKELALQFAIMNSHSSDTIAPKVPININVNVNVSVRSKDERRFLFALGQNIGQLEAIAKIPAQESLNVADILSPEEQALLDRFDKATTAIANRIRDLIANPPASPNDPVFNAKLTAIADGLEALGKTADTLPPQP